MSISYCDDKVGDRVVLLRRRLYPNRRDFARQIPGMSYQDISDIENGDRQPRLEEILVLARKLGVRVRYLETGKGLVALGPQELGHIHDFLGDSESRKRRRLAKYHNGH